MIKPLRNTHRRIWLMLALLLPAGIIAAWLVAPDSAPVTILSEPAQQLLPVIQAKRESAQYCIYIRSSMDNTDWQIEWKNKLPLTVPSAVIYRTEGRERNIHKAQLIGRIEARGDYVFRVQPDSTWHNELNLLLYDFIHERVVDSLNFKINQ
jgi:hypothetical protein